MDHRSVRALVRKATSRQKKAAELLAQPDKTIEGALTEAGYSPMHARKGMAAVSATILALMPRETNFVELGRALTPEQQESLVRGRLVLNVIRGKDQGVNSAYRLGQDKRVNMFQADAQVGVLIVNAPDSGVKIASVPDEVPSKE